MTANLVDLLVHPTAIVGVTGSGKTFAAKGAVEALIRAKRRVIILDPTGAWWGLRSGAGRKDEGLPVMIFGGEHADLPIVPEAAAGKALGAALAERDVQAIIDTSEMTGGEKVRFLTPFLEALYAKNKAALHIVVDEADEIAAQRIADGEQRLFGIFDKIVRRGRIKGFRPLMITQRPAVIHKNVLSQVGTLIALKLTSPQDRKAIEEWVKGNADAGAARKVMTSLPTLSRGEGWVWAPADDVLERVHFPPITTFDSSRTPGNGEVITAPALAPIDVQALREEMAASIPEVPVARRSANGRPADDAEAIWQKAFERGLAEGYRAGKSDGGRHAAHAQMKRIVEALAGAAMVVGDAGALCSALEKMESIQIYPDASAPSAVATDPDPVPRAAAKPASPAKAAIDSPATGVDPLLAVALKIWPAKLSWAALAAACGRKARGGHFNSVRKRLIDTGQVTELAGLVIPSSPPDAPAGIAAADLLAESLPQPSRKMFVAIRQYPGITLDGLATVLQMQPRGGHWNSGLSVLRKNGLITDADGLRISSGLERATDG